MKLWPHSTWCTTFDMIVPLFLGGVGKHQFVRNSDTFRLGENQPDKYIRGTYVSPFVPTQNFMMARTTFEKHMVSIRDDVTRWFLKSPDDCYFSGSDATAIGGHKYPDWSPDENDAVLFPDRSRAINTMIEHSKLTRIELWMSSGSWDNQGKLMDTSVFRRNLDILRLTPTYRYDGSAFSTTSDHYEDKDADDIAWVLELADLEDKEIFATAQSNETWRGMGPRVFWSELEFVKWKLGADLDRFEITTASELTSA